MIWTVRAIACLNVFVVRGANTPVDPEAEERKGGAQAIAKAFLSAGDDRLCIYLHVPENLNKVCVLKSVLCEWMCRKMIWCVCLLCLTRMWQEVSITEWFDVLVKAAKATVLQAPQDGFAKAETLKANEVFPLKLRDEAIGQVGRMFFFD